MTWPWHGETLSRTGEFAKARARAEVDAMALRDRAARTVAGQAVDEEDRHRLLSMLGLEGAAAVPAVATSTMTVPDDGVDETVTLMRRLGGYVRAVAAAVQVPAEATGFEVSDTATIYLGLAERWGSRSRDLMLVWSEQHGWLVAVETDPGEPPVVIDYLGGDDVVPDPHTVAWFVTDVISGRRTDGSRRVDFSTSSDRKELVNRLQRYDKNT